MLIIHLLKRGGESTFDPVGASRVEEGDQVTLQATITAYQGLREKLLAA